MDWNYCLDNRFYPVTARYYWFPDDWRCNRHFRSVALPRLRGEAWGRDTITRPLSQKGGSMISLFTMFLEFCMTSEFMLYSFSCLLVLGLFNAIKALQ